MGSKINDLFLSASKGDKKAYQEVYNWFIDQGLIIALSTAKILNIRDLNIDEAALQLSDLFLAAVRSYSLSYAPFDQYSLYLIRKRISRIVQDNSSYMKEKIISLDSVDEDGFSLLESVQSPEYENMQGELYVKNDKQLLASKKIIGCKVEGKVKKVMKLKECGYRKGEIIKMMNITDGQYRYLIHQIFLINKDKETFEMK